MLPDNALCSLEELNSYVDNHDSDPGIVAIKEILIETASTVIRDYLGYDPVQASYTDELYSGPGDNMLIVRARPVVSVEKMVVNGSEVDTSGFLLKDWMIFTDSYTIPKGKFNVRLDYTAGYLPAEIPAIMKTTCLRIAGTLNTESNGNIGISSKSFADGSRQFNRIQFDRYLEVLKKYKIK